jgi:hypothetical protein
LTELNFSVPGRPGPWWKYVSTGVNRGS